MAVKDIVKGICNITRCKYDVYTKDKIDELLGTINTILETKENKETVLYNNVNGTNSEINLSDNVKNYKYIEIYFCTNDTANYQSSAKIYSPNGKYASLLYVLSRADTTSVYLKSKNVYIEGTSIRNYDERATQVTISNDATSISNANNIYITRVVGYK